MTTVVLVDSDFPDSEVERDVLARSGLDLAEAEAADPDAVQAAAPDARGLLVQWTRVDAAMLDALPRLRAVGRFGVGVDSIDVDEASRRRVVVTHSGDYATEEVAAHTVALALALLRRLPAGDRAVRSGDWTRARHFVGMRRLSGLRAGVVGLGRIGSRVGEHLAALGMDVAGYDPVCGSSRIPLAESLDDLVAASDLVTLHVPLTADTRGLIDARRLALLPDGAVLVNAARGGLVDEEALIHELALGRLGGAGLDVFEHEPLSAGHALCARDDILLSPHVGYFSEEALVEARTRTAAGVAAVLAGEQPSDVANPEVLEAIG
jgi:D-3-phosphoglycerate dehydrogenase